MKGRFFLRSLGFLLLKFILVVGLRAELLTIATYNVENYGPANRMTEAGYRQDYPKPEAEKRALRTVIKGLKADVLVLQEMGGQPYLDELQRDLKTEGTDYPYAVLLEGNDADRHVALLSKRPLKSVVSHVDLEFAYFNGKERVKRGLLEVTITTEAGDVTIFALHLKSRFTDRPDDPMSAQRRTGEATAVRDRVLQRVGDPAKTRFLIIGDFNDTKDSKAVSATAEAGENRNRHAIARGGHTRRNVDACLPQGRVLLARGPYLHLCSAAPGRAEWHGAHLRRSGSPGSERPPAGVGDAGTGRVADYRSVTTSSTAVMTSPAKSD